MSDSNIILIPSTRTDYRIGSVFNNFFQISNCTESMEGEVVWDFSNVEFLHPFFIAPLALYRNFSEKKISCINMSNELKSYFKLIHFDGLFGVNEASKGELTEYTKKSYIPISAFDATDSTCQSVFQNIIQTQCNCSELVASLQYFFSELIDNVVEHSKSEKVFLFSQYLPKEGAVDVCIADNGIGIYSSYIDRAKFIEEIGNDEAKALKMANEGLSTKDRPGAESRGYGISTTKRALVHGIGGSFFMLSGSAFHRSYPGEEEKYVNLPKSINWQGTIILMRIPTNIPKKFNLYNYIE